MNARFAPVAVLSFAIAAACSGTDRDQQSDGNLAMAATPAPAPAHSLDDPTIVAIFDAANTADIETGALAAKKGHSKEVREFGAMLTHDHTAVRKLGRDLAARLSVTPTPPADDASAKAHADAMAKLRTLKGEEFDKAFLDHEVAFHQSVIDAVGTTLMPAIQNAELKELVARVAPNFEAHRAKAAHLRSKING